MAKTQTTQKYTEEQIAEFNKSKVGTLWLNQNKDGNGSHYSGTITVEGKSVKVAGFVRTGVSTKFGVKDVIDLKLSTNE